MTVCVPRNFDGPSSAEHEPIKISLSVTPATPCACTGIEAVNANTQITLSPRPRFKIEFFISLSVLRQGPLRMELLYTLFSPVMWGCQRTRRATQRSGKL